MRMIYLIGTHCVCVTTFWNVLLEILLFDTGPFSLNLNVSSGRLVQLRAACFFAPALPRRLPRRRRPQHPCHV